MGKVCFLFGHRDMPYDVREEIQSAAERHYQEYGIRQFIVGGHGAFDSMAASALGKFKQRHDDVVLNRLIPYHPAEHAVWLPAGFDGTYYPEGMEKVPRRFAIVRANQYMVRAADSVICFVRHFGNTRALLEQAEQRKKRGELFVENLAEPISFL